MRRLSRVLSQQINAVLILGLLGLLGIGCFLPAGLAQPEGRTPEPNEEEPEPVAETLLELTVAPVKQIFSAREGITVVAILKAKEDVTVCLEKDPMTQFDFELHRAGTGRLQLIPLISRDNRLLYRQRQPVKKLRRGERHVVRLNLRRLELGNGERWDAGDYRLKATFRLCDPKTVGRWDSSDEEYPLPARAAAHFYLMQ